MKMKKIFLIITVAVLLCGCRFPEGPFISFNDIETRLTGYWQLGYSYCNGEEVTKETTIDYNRPGSYYAFFGEGTLTVTAIHNGLQRESPAGSWYFVNKRNGELDIHFMFMANEYHYVAKVKKLSLKELIYEYDDLEGNHWRLEFFTRSHI